MWYIDNFVFNKVLINISLSTAKTARALLLKVPFVQMLTDQQQDLLAEIAYVMKYPKDTKLLQEYQQTNSLYVIQSGRIELRKLGKPVHNLSSGDYFGENNIYGREKKIPIAFTTEETIVIQLTREMVEDKLNEPVKFCILRNVIQEGFKNSE